MVNYYELLNVSRDATKEEIELALARCMLSPNKNNDISLAFDILTKETIRKLYNYSLDVPLEVGEIIQSSLKKYIEKNAHIAINILNEGLKHYPDQREIMLVLSRMYCFTGQAQESINVLVVLYENYPDDNDVVFSLGYAYNCLRNYSTSYLYLRTLYKTLNRDVEYLNLYAEACVHLGKYERAYCIAAHNIKHNYGYDELIYSYVYLIIAQYYINKNVLENSVGYFIKYMHEEVSDVSLAGDCLDKLLHFVLDNVMQDEDVSLLIDVLVKIYRIVGANNARAEVVLFACDLSLECLRMVESGINEKISSLCKNYICLLLSDVFHDLKRETYEAKIAINKLEIVELYDFTYEEIGQKLPDEYPLMTELVSDFINDFRQLDLEELVDKYNKLYENMINGE
jgi:hypothetical protein